MAYRVVRSADADEDLETIYAHLIRSHLKFGYSLVEAVDLAGARLRRIQKLMDALGLVPFQGTRRDRILKGLRSATKERAILYFTVDEAKEHVHVLAVFFSGQDHLPQIVARLKSEAG
jgi:plasmid stabilization system protein ParE